MFGFTTRYDSSMKVLKNKEAFFKRIFGSEFSDVIFLEAEQTHTNKVAVATLDNLKEQFNEVKHVDAVVYRRLADKKVCLLTKFADCVPILFTDEKNNIIAVAHSGWKGTLGNIISHVIEEMIKSGADKKDITAHIGPCIGGCCYRVEESRAELFREKYGETGIIKNTDNTVSLSLTTVIRSQLVSAGVAGEQIRYQPSCTSCQNNTYFSYRREQAGVGMMTGYICI